MGIRGLLLFMALLSAVPLSAQKKSELKAIWLEAQSHYLYEEYELANPLYLILNDLIPGNANIKYKIGNCYLNILDEKQKAIPFLEAAVKNTSYDSKTDKLKETRAPLDAYFSLGNAYRIANMLDSATLTYQMFRRLVSEAGEMENQDFINQQMQACNIALEQMKTPVLVSVKPYKEYLNQGSVNDRPVMSFDGNTMAYTERRGLESVVYVTRREGESWGTPTDITAQSMMGTDCHTSSLNDDGTELYLYKNDNYDGNIYVTKYTGGKWSPITKLNDFINTKFYESHASISADGKKLYFTSNRAGGIGELDIWMSERDATGDWGVPVNLGSTTNTPFNEETPFISKDGLTLTFSSEGHSSMGGYDFFKSVNVAGTWGKPVNLGYPLSTTDDDLGFQPFDDFAFGHYSLMTGYKKKEIALVTFNPPYGDETADTTALADTVKMNFDPDSLPYISLSDTTAVITNLSFRDVKDSDADEDPDVLYYTVQVMALYNPVDPAYFDYAVITVYYTADDRFFRYTTGKFDTKLEAYIELSRLLRLGYPDDIFVKKVYKNDTRR